MKISQQRAKWILVVACLLLALCVIERTVQRVVNPPVPAQPTLSTSQTNESLVGESRCALSAKSLPGHTPLLDLALPVLLMLWVMSHAITLPILRSALTLSSPLAPRRRHLTFCVFRL